MRRTASLLTTLAIALPLAAQEHTIARKDLPPAVEKAVQEQSAGATIKGFATEREHGKKVYEVEMIVNGHSKDLQLALDGTVNEIEEEVSFDGLPADIQSSLLARAAGAKIVKVESLTKHGKLVAYEAATQKGTRKGEIQVGPAGERLVHPE